MAARATTSGRIDYTYGDCTAYPAGIKCIYLPGMNRVIQQVPVFPSDSWQRFNQRQFPLTTRHPSQLIWTREGDEGGEEGKRIIDRLSPVDLGQAGAKPPILYSKPPVLDADCNGLDVDSLSVLAKYLKIDVPSGPGSADAKRAAICELIRAPLAADEADLDREEEARTQELAQLDCTSPEVDALEDELRVIVYLHALLLGMSDVQKYVTQVPAYILCQLLKNIQTIREQKDPAIIPALSRAVNDQFKEAFLEQQQLEQQQKEEMKAAVDVAVAEAAAHALAAEAAARALAEAERKKQEEELQRQRAAAASAASAASAATAAATEHALQFQRMREAFEQQRREEQERIRLANARYEQWLADEPARREAEREAERKKEEERELARQRAARYEEERRREEEEYKARRVIEDAESMLALQQDRKYWMTPCVPTLDESKTWRDFERMRMRKSQLPMSRHTTYTSKRLVSDSIGADGKLIEEETPFHLTDKEFASAFAIERAVRELNARGKMASPSESLGALVTYYPDIQPVVDFLTARGMTLESVLVLDDTLLLTMLAASGLPDAVISSFLTAVRDQRTIRTILHEEEEICKRRNQEIEAQLLWDRALREKGEKRRAALDASNEIMNRLEADA